jgi:hypothetical protein
LISTQRLHRRRRKEGPRLWSSPDAYTQSIDPPEIAVIAHKIWGLFVAIGNRGPSTVLACTGRDEEKITPNALRVILIQGELTIEAMDGKCATVELEFIPRAI